MGFFNIGDKNNDGFGRLSITADKAKSIAKLPAELDSLSSLIRRAAKRGDAGVWLPASDEAKIELRKQGFELSVNQKEHPNKVWIWWGN